MTVERDGQEQERRNLRAAREMVRLWLVQQGGPDLNANVRNSVLSHAVAKQFRARRPGEDLLGYYSAAVVSKAEEGGKNRVALPNQFNLMRRPSMPPARHPRQDDIDKLDLPRQISMGGIGNGIDWANNARGG